MTDSGDCTVFGQAALEHIDALYGYALMLTRNQAEAEDLVQETYVRAIRAFGRLTAHTNAKSWLFVIMRNAWLNQVRHNRSGPHFVELEDDQSESWPTSPADPHTLYLRKLEREEVKTAIQTLPPIYREIIVLRDIEGFTYQEIATMLGCPAGTVMSRLGRAREKMRALLAAWQPKAAAKAV